MKKPVFISALVAIILVAFPMHSFAGIKKIVAGVAVYEVKKHGPGLAANYMAHKVKKMANQEANKVVMEKLKDRGRDIALDAITESPRR